MIKRIEQMQESGVVEIRGRSYKTVAKRIAEFREKHPDYSMVSEVVSMAELICIRTTISDPTGRVLATGHAEEQRGSTQINATSAMENCETSSWGRCLANFGLGGQEIASAEEIANALQQQDIREEHQWMAAHMQAVLANWDLVQGIKTAIAEASLPPEERTMHFEDAAREWYELPEETQHALRRAWTKGGCWTPAESNYLREHLRRAAYGDDWKHGEKA